MFSNISDRYLCYFKVWNRLQVKGETNIRQGEEITQKVVGLDCSAMYLVSLSTELVFQQQTAFYLQGSMNELPSGIPVQWINENGVFKKHRTLPGYGTSRGEIEYCLFMGKKHGHNLCDSNMDGEGQIQFLPKKPGASENLDESEEGDDQENGEDAEKDEEKDDEYKKYRRYNFDLVIKSKKEIHSYAGCWQ